MADQDPTPVFQIQRVYLKDVSLEQPNSPQILIEQGPNRRSTSTWAWKCRAGG